MNNTTTNMNNTIATTSNCFTFEAVLNEASVTDAMHGTMVETMFNIVVTNTVRKGVHVTENYLACMKKVFGDFLNANEFKFVVSDRDIDETFKTETFDFSGDNDEWEEEAIRMIAMLKKERLTFELAYDQSDNKKGFVGYDESKNLEKELIIVR